MLLTVGATYVILGHSERRQYHDESDKLVNAKAKRALQSGLTPIICVGETIDQREAGRTEEVVGSQIDGTTAGFGADDLSKIVIAYEPVWAIGTGKTATPEMAQAVHRFIRDRLSAVEASAAERLPILYGGSVKPGNAAELLSQPDIDGALVGGASLKADDFIGIIKAA
jgi:triosephosphate isomerase